VAHGDLKPLNLVIDSDEGSSRVTCQIIDFGGSAVIGQERFPQHSIPWNAPELFLDDLSVEMMPAESLIQADLFSLGLVLAHILIPLDVLGSKKLCLLRTYDRETFLHFKGLVQQQNLAETFVSLARESQICSEIIGLLEQLLPGLLHIQPGERKLNYELVQNLLRSYGLAM
jgi:serine/threonine protein kinase